MDYEVKRYVAHSLEEIMEAVKKDFGSDGVIMNVRKFTEKKYWIFGGEEKYEVLAGIGMNVPTDSSARKERSQTTPQLPVRRPRPIIEKKPEPRFQEPDPRSIYIGDAADQSPDRQAPQHVTYSKPQPAQQPQQPQPVRQQQQPVQQPVYQQAPQDGSSAEILKLIDKMQKSIEQLAAGKMSAPTPGPDASPVYSGKLQKVFELMKRSEVSPNVIEKLMNDLQSIPNSSKENWDNLKEHLRLKMSDMIKVSGQRDFDQTPEPAPGGEKMPKLIAFVGTTGVGKTTTLAKIATNMVLKSKKKVVFFTIDTFRVAATDQIKVYGDIIGIPVEIIYKESDFLPYVMKHKDADVILIDTAGRSQKNNLDLLELKKYLHNGSDLNIEIFLVLSATTRYRDMLDISNNFKKVNYSKLIITKTDETTTWGSIMSISFETGKAISYIGNGQNVPDDIMPADSNSIIRKIIEYEEA